MQAQSDSPSQLLYDALKRAFKHGKSSSSEQLPEGFLNVKAPGFFKRVRHKAKVILTVKGRLVSELYQQVAKQRNFRFTEHSSEDGEVRDLAVLSNLENMLAISYRPEMSDSHIVTVNDVYYAQNASMFLADYLSLLKNQEKR